MKPYFVKTPYILTKWFKQYLWRFNDAHIYLTFDDGPIPEVTPWVIDTLHEFKAKATFFCVGENIEKYPQIFDKLLSHQHTVGNHTFNHLNGWQTKVETYLNNVEVCEKKLGKASQKWFRPPYGKLSLSQSKALIKQGYRIVMWDVLSADFDTKISTEQCLANVLNNLKPGSIVVLHDHVKSFEKLKVVLPEILKYGQSKGYQFKALS